MNTKTNKKSGLRKLLDAAKGEGPEARGVGKNLFNEIAGIGWEEENTIAHEGALEETEALAESSNKLSKQLGDMLPVLESASIARPVMADLEKVENLLGEVERRVKVVRAALSRLESSGIVRASGRKKDL